MLKARHYLIISQCVGADVGTDLSTSLTVYVQYSPVMERQYLNIDFRPSINLRYETEGLCGTWDDVQTNDFRGRDGTLYEHAIPFVDSCKVRGGCVCGGGGIVGICPDSGGVYLCSVCGYHQMMVDMTSS